MKGDLTAFQKAKLVPDFGFRNPHSEFRILRLHPQVRVQHIPEPVSQDVEGNDRYQDGDPRHGGDPPGGGELIAGKNDQKFPDDHHLGDGESEAHEKEGQMEGKI